MPVANENNKKDINNSQEGAQSGKPAAPKKKLNIVFRKQNSTSIKELPKRLKNAADMSEHKGKAESSQGNAGAAKRPRPLPAGTKPVRPAANLSDKKAEAAAATENIIKPETKPETKPIEEKVKEAETRVKEMTAQDTPETALTENAVKDTDNAKAVKEEAAAAEETVKREAANDKAAMAETADKEPSEAVSEAEVAEPEVEKNAQSPAREEEAAGEKAEKPKAPSLADPVIPKVKIVKSYANYDAAAVIAEASRQAKKENSLRNSQRGGSSDGQHRGRTGDAQRKQDQGGQSGRQHGDNQRQGGRSFAGKPQDQRGQRPGQPGDKRSQQAGAQRGFDAPAGKSPRGRNAFAGKDNRKDKKDKYVDDLAAEKKKKKGAFIKPEPKKEKPEEEIKVIVIPETLTIKDLAEKLHLQPSVIVKKLFLAGKMVTPNTDLSYEEAEEIAMDYDILCEKEVEEDVIAELLKEEDEDESKLVLRNPVVCVMGHVDHGKTSLLDAIRNTNVTSREAGGITQHIGASVVSAGDRYITFLDTPGHEAFTAMRLRGAQSTDIAVLVVAADDGVKPQTIEAISHAKAANVEVIVAINKMDKPTANPDMVKNELSEYGLIAEEWGGTTPMVEVSAKTGAGISDLLDMILLEADVMELKANPDRKARGLVIEAQLDKGRGPIATVLVQKGTLKVGDNVVAGSCYGKVRAMFDDKHNQIKKALPSYPAEILGLNDVPDAGEVFMVCKDEKEARSIAETFIAEQKKHMLDETKKKMNLDDLFDEIKAGNIKELPIIIKADVQGSVEAVKQSLGKLSNEEVAVNVIHAAAGNINESDVNLASAANAIIIGFNVKPDAVAKAKAEQEKIDMRLYRVIYQAIEDLQSALTGMLAPVYEPQNTGRAVVRQIFKASGVGTIAGCYVTDGVIERGSRARLFRGDKQIFDGDIASLKRFKDEVKEVKLGFECGIVLDDFTDVQVDDTLEIYKMVQVPRA